MFAAAGTVIGYADEAVVHGNGDAGRSWYRWNGLARPALFSADGKLTTPLVPLIGLYAGRSPGTVFARLSLDQ